MKSIVIFDLDGTIDNADTFAAFLAGMLLRSPSRWWRLPILAWAFIMHYGLSLRDNFWLKSTFLKHIIGHRDIVPIEAYARVFAFNRCEKFLNQRIVHEINRLRADAAHLVIATASPDIYVRYIAEHLNIPKVISTRVVTNNKGQWTGALVEGNCHGERKQQLITQFLNSIGGSWVDVIYYSDHHSDLPTLKSAGKAFAVNPSPKLEKLLIKYGIQKF